MVKFIKQLSSDSLNYNMDSPAAGILLIADPVS